MDQCPSPRRDLWNLSELDKIAYPSTTLKGRQHETILTVSKPCSGCPSHNFWNLSESDKIADSGITLKGQQQETYSCTSSQLLEIVSEYLALDFGSFLKGPII